MHVIELPIYKTKTDHPRFLRHQEGHKDKKKHKNKKHKDHDKVSKKAQNLSSKSTLEHDVANHDNYAYSTELYVGSNLQPLNLLLDTGSSIMWLQSEECDP